MKSLDIKKTASRVSFVGPEHMFWSLFLSPSKNVWVLDFETQGKFENGPKPLHSWVNNYFPIQRAIHGGVTVPRLRSTFYLVVPEVTEHLQSQENSNELQHFWWFKCLSGSELMTFSHNQSGNMNSREQCRIPMVTQHANFC